MRPVPRALRRGAAPALLLLAGAALAGCGEGGLASGLRSAGVANTPDEFLVLPTRPLELPPDLSTLPPPTPGQRNRVAYVPEAEAITALSGRPPAAAPSAPALVARAGPSAPAIRSILVEEDAQYRDSNQLLLFERWFGPDRERQIYASQILDADAELERLRARGVRTPAAPPLPED
jgi:hypothetical protein